MTHREAVQAEWEDPERVEQWCQHCDLMHATLRLDDGRALCEPCCAQMTVLMGETEYTVRHLGTVYVPHVQLVWLDVECEQEQNKVAA